MRSSKEMSLRAIYFGLILWIATFSASKSESFLKTNLPLQSFSPETSLKSYEICTSNSSDDSRGTLTSPGYNSSYHVYAYCFFYIHATVGYNGIEINVNDIYTYGAYSGYSYLEIDTSVDNSSWSALAVLATTSGTVNLTYTAKNYVRILFYVYSSSVYGRFRLTWKFLPIYPISPPTNSACQGPDILFLLDRSQAIYPDFYNNTIKSFLRNATAKYSFSDDITSQNPFSSRFGIIEFSDDATVSVPLKQYSRNEFFLKIQNNVSYGNGGESNVAAALSLAYDEFMAHGTSDDGNFKAPRMIILIVNDISNFGFSQTLAAMNNLKTLVQLPIGVIVPGLPEIPPGAIGRLANLTGNANYTFGDYQTAVTGVPALSDLTFKCQICSNLIFICETTVAIGWESKLRCLKLAQKLALASAHNFKQRYAIALYGVQIYNPIQMQTLYDFNNTITGMINNMQNNNTPNGGQTYLAPILNQLATTLGNKTISAQYAVLIMGEVSVIRDPSPAYKAVQTIAALNSDIYVLDETHNGSPSNLWSTLTKNQETHIVNGTAMTDLGDLFMAFDTTLMQDFEKIKC